MSTPRQLIQNAVRVLLKDGTYHYLKSTHHYDFAAYTENGKMVAFCDGGLDYCRTGGNVEDWCLYTDSPITNIRARLLWGTYGIKGDQPLKWKPLAECDLDHLKAILATQRHIVGGLVERVVKYWIKEKDKT